MSGSTFKSERIYPIKVTALSSSDEKEIRDFLKNAHLESIYFSTNNSAILEFGTEGRAIEACKMLSEHKKFNANKELTVFHLLPYILTEVKITENDKLIKRTYHSNCVERRCPRNIFREPFLNLPPEFSGNIF